jgi:hypothetical protein
VILPNGEAVGKALRANIMQLVALLAELSQSTDALYRWRFIREKPLAVARTLYLVRTCLRL